MADASRALVIRFQGDAAPLRKATADVAKATGAMAAAVAADVLVFNRAFNAAGDVAVKFGARAGMAALGFARLAPALAAASAAIAAYQFATGKAMDVAIAKLEEYIVIAEKAKKAGLGTTLTQALGTLAPTALDTAKPQLDARGGQTELLRSIEKLQGAGRLGAGGFQALLDLDSTRNLEERFRAIIRIIDDLMLNGQRLAALDLAEKLLGAEAGRRLVEQMRETGRSLGDLVREAEKGGDIVPPAAIANAEELKQRLEASAKQLKDDFKPLMADIAALGTAVYRGWVSIQEAINTAFGSLGRFYSTLREIVALIPRLPQRFISPGPEVSDAAQQDLARAGALGARIKAGALPPGDPGRADAQRLAASLAYDARVFDESGTGRREMPEVIGRVKPPQELFLPLPGSRPADLAAAPKGGGGGKKEAAERTDEIERFLESYRKSVELLEVESRLIGKSAAEREKATQLIKAEQAARAAGRELSTEETAQLIALIDKKNEYAKAIENAKNAQEAFNEVARFAGTSIASFLSDIVSGGKNAERALMNLTKRLAEAALQAALLGEGPLAGIMGMKGQNGQLGGLLGGLFNGLRGGGGVPMGAFGTGAGLTVPMYASGAGQIPRDMLAGLHKGEMVVPAYDAEKMRRGGMGGTTINVTYLPGTQGEQTSRRGPDGREMVDIVVGKVKQNMGEGGFDPLYQQRFRANPATIRR